MQCVAVCCSVLQRFAVCCSVLQCVAVCCSESPSLPTFAVVSVMCVMMSVMCVMVRVMCVIASVMFVIAIHHQITHTCYSSVLQSDGRHCARNRNSTSLHVEDTPQHTATHCNTLQHTATHCTTLHDSTEHTHINESHIVAKEICVSAKEPRISETEQKYLPATV